MRKLRSQEAGQRAAAFQPAIVYVIHFPWKRAEQSRDVVGLYDRPLGYAEAHERRQGMKNILSDV